MKSITALAVTTACALTLTACGGSGGYDNGSTNDTTGGGNGNNNNGAITGSQDLQGIWIDSNQSMTMQSIILSDGSYYGVYGPTTANGSFIVYGALGHGKYTYGSTYGYGNIYYGVATENNIETPLVDYLLYGGDGGWAPQTFLTATGGGGQSMSLDVRKSEIYRRYGISNFNMAYDNIYRQPASLASIAGVYQGVGYDGKTDSLGSKAHRGVYKDIADDMELPAGRLTIFGSNLTLDDGSCVTGTVAPHGTGNVNVFDVTLAVSCDLIKIGAPFQIVYTGTTFKGILFQTSNGYTEIIAPAGVLYSSPTLPPETNNVPVYFFIGNR